jgi:hypothetical protein
VANLKANVEYNLITLSWTDSGAAACRVTRSDGEVSTENTAMFTDTKFPREKPLTYKIEAIGGDGKAAAAVSIEMTPETTLKAPPIPPLPTVYLDATNTKFVQNTAGQARFGPSYNNNKLSLDGKAYDKGIGKHTKALAVALPSPKRSDPALSSRFTAMCWRWVKSRCCSRSRLY